MSARPLSRSVSLIASYISGYYLPPTYSKFLQGLIAATTNMGCFHSHEASHPIRPRTPPRSHSHPWNAHQIHEVNENYSLAPAPSGIQDQNAEPVSDFQRELQGQFNPETLQGRLEALAKHQAVMESIGELQGKDRHVA